MAAKPALKFLCGSGASTSSLARFGRRDILPPFFAGTLFSSYRLNSHFMSGG